MMPLFDREPEPQAPRPCVNIANLGSLVSLIATDSEGTYHFEHGDLIVSPGQFFDMVKYRRTIPS